MIYSKISAHNSGGSSGRLASVAALLALGTLSLLWIVVLMFNWENWTLKLASRRRAIAPGGVGYKKSPVNSHCYNNIWTGHSATQARLLMALPFIYSSRLCLLYIGICHRLFFEISSTLWLLTGIHFRTISFLGKRPLTPYVRPPSISQTRSRDILTWISLSSLAWPWS